ncbi:thiamine pyrophosphate-dependent enzyme, possible carboligase or decarboxylase [Rhizobium sp. CF122]|uniref:thiamine pyrophosphate-requiring protein n=1 Tax=Rhizobium sp. CF122 TaxID=1144312 RepID=UPI000271A128|nr:thiamine pyrophosphate-requiring protein [Rhizobium sp. CF122]EJL50473.1 thiamine pyrophosphate-dependent enzyme, possible carboligase or decarboxylase [Rhizobium sp. CF122]
MDSNIERQARGETITAGGALLARLKAIGIDYIFANSGTDFPPIIEGLAEADAKGIPLPEAIVIPHESAAMGMAHGYYLATGRPQAVMAHTNVGLANCAIGAINAATEHIPLLLFSGKTPASEMGHLGSRTVPIGWGQEMRDQAALVREAVKWDDELRFPEHVPQMVDRAHAIAMSTPRGPVYMSLPREVLCQPCPTEGLGATLQMEAFIHAPDPRAIEEAARLLSCARQPVIFAQRGAGSKQGFAALRALVEEWAIPVCQYWAVQLALPSDHPMAAQADPEPLLAQADVVLVIDALAPWSPDIHSLNDGCKVIQLGQDPLFQRFPVRYFRSHVTIACDVADGLAALRAAMSRLSPATDIERRSATLTKRNGEARAAVLARAEAGCAEPMTKEWVSLTLSKTIGGRPATVLSELGCPLAPMQIADHRGWYQEPHSGGLGWAFPAALGMQLADRDRLVVATMGDGSYIFSNPVACHQIAEALALPILLIIVNNAEWGAVRQSVVGIYPDGYAAKANRMPLTSLSPIPDFTKIAQASRAHAERVERGGDLDAALARAIRHIDENRSMALLDVRVRA